MTPLAQDLADVLAPCPCGLPAHRSGIDGTGKRSISCNAEDCFWSVTGFTDDQVRDRWNRRSPALAALVEDAERYRWLREAAQTTTFELPRWSVARESGGMGQTYRGEKLDAAIDAARAESAK